MIIDGKKITTELLKELTEQVKNLPFKPLLVDILVGSDPVSLSYVRIKERIAKQVGIDFNLVQLSKEATAEDTLEQIELIQNQQNLSGLIIQLPLPKHFDSQKVLSQINPEVDVDLLSPKSSELFYQGLSKLIPPTPSAILHILDSLKLESGLQYVVMGQGDLVGKPVAYLLEQRGEKVLTMNSDTLDKNEVLQAADVLITGIGKPSLVTGQALKQGVVVIDAGTSESSGSIKGDVDFESCRSKAKFITPVPGGVGPVTVAKLLENVILVAKGKMA